MDSFVAIDFETANQHRTSVCSVGLVFVENYKIKAKKEIPGLTNYKLTTVSRYFGFNLENHHHALADAEACAHIAMALF